jgi:gliding motility-associated-like protein
MFKTLFIFYGLFILFLIDYNQSFAQVNLNSGLVAYFPFSGNANDASGNNIHGTGTNVVLTADQSGKANSAYLFNGTTSYIELPYSNLYNFPPSGAFSIAAWVQPDINQPSYGAVVVKSPFQTDFFQSKWNYGGYITSGLKAMNGYADNNLLESNAVFQNSPCWYHVIWAYDNGNWYIYIDGKLDASQLLRNRFILQDGSSKIVIGKKGEAFGNFYKGKLDEVRIYNRLLTQAEINVLADNGVHPVATPDTTVCINSSFQLRATGTDTYQWTPSVGLSASNISNPTVTVSSPMQYIVTGKSVTGCAANDTVSIKLVSVPVIAKSKDTAICFGSAGIQLFVSGGSGYVWTPSNSISNNTVPNPVVNPVTTTVYQVNISYAPACSITDSVKVAIIPKMNLVVTPHSVDICQGNSVPLTASGGVNYIWSPSTSLSDPAIASPVASPTVTTRYYITATDVAKCQAMDSITITVSSSYSQSEYLVPNAFTPNKDRLNDCFGVSHWKGVSSFQFDIYNRWGQKIFSTNDPAKCWDGRYRNGELAESGNYQYIIKAEATCGMIDRKGSVILIR